MIVRRGFTLIELLVVISIIALLIGILLPALSSARQTAITLKCATQIRQLGFGFRMYGSDNKDRIPYAAITTNKGEMFSYDDLIAEYIGNERSYAEKAASQLLPSRASEILICPNDPSEDLDLRAPRSYSMVRGYDSTTEKDENGNPLPEGVGITTQAKSTGTPSYITPFLFDSQQIPDSSGTIIASERMYTPRQQGNLNLYNTQGHLTTALTDQLRRAKDQVKGGFTSEVTIPHGTKKQPIYNYLYVDGHVETQTPEETIGTTTSVNSSRTKGAWTRKAGD